MLDWMMMPDTYWTKERIEAFERRYENGRRLGPHRTAVRIVGTDLEFPSIAACARHLRVSQPTIKRLIETKEKYGDVQIEVIEE